MLNDPLLSKVLPLAAVFSCLVQSVFSADRLDDVVAIKVDRRNAHQNERAVLKAVLRHDGNQTILTNSVVELKTGRNRFDESLRQWVEADDRVELMDGAAVGRGTAHKTIFSANLNDPEGTIDLLTPDKKRMRSQVVGVAYTERNTGRSVFIAEIIDSTGELQDRNSIVYPRAFDAINADIRYRHSLAGLEQDVIFREELPTPEEFDLDSRETYLEIWTHFLETPDPEKTRHAIHRHLEKTQHDETLNFGEMEIIAGRAFDTGEEDQNVGVLVAKEWVKIDRMTFLIESVPVIDVAKRLSALPKRAVARKTVDKLDVLRNANRGSNRLVAVRRKPASLKSHKPTNITPEARKHLIAKSINQTPAGLFLIDYTLVSTTPNFTFRADTTYYVSGPVTLSGTTTFEGGTVIKYDNTATTKLIINGSIDMKSSMYRPILMTAKHDSTVGEQIEAGTPAGFYANPALVLNGGNSVYDLSDFRISYAQLAIQVDQNHSVYGGHNLRNFQLVSCNNGFRASHCELKFLNGLLWNVGTGFELPYYTTNILQNITINNSTNLQLSPTATSLSLLNCVLTQVSNQGTIGGGFNANLSSSNGVYQSIGTAGHYLAANSIYRNSGTPSIDTTLAEDLKTRTTYAPTQLSTPITSDTTLRPQAMRDVDIPDLGYHYPPLDWIASDVQISNACLTLTNGVTIGVYGETGFKLQAGAKLIGSGTPLSLNRLVRYQAVQEIAHDLWNVGSNWTLLKEDLSSGSAPEIRLRFTEFSLLPNGGDHLNGGDKISDFSLTDCQFSGGRFLFAAGGSYARKIALTNSLFEGVDLTFGNGSDSTLTTYGRNNLFYRCDTIEMNPVLTNTWEWRDNAFHDSGLVFNSGDIPASGNNAYIAGNGRIQPMQASDIVLTNFTYASSSLGRFYQVSTNLQDKGSRTADAAGLFHHTTRGGSTKEGATQVDIGFHYTAVTSLVPWDSDGDGVADYQEDWNGNEIYEPSYGESNWEESSNGTTGIPALTVFTILE